MDGLRADVPARITLPYARASPLAAPVGRDGTPTPGSGTGWRGARILGHRSGATEEGATSMSTRVILTLGTKKGVFLYSSDAGRSRWRLSGPFLAGQDVNHVMLDARTGTLYATGNDPWFGPRVTISQDLGESWHDAQRSPHFAEGSPLGSVARLWRIEPGRASEPGRLWCGVDPAALFRSDDGGETWDEVSGLSEHETRARW